MRSARASATHSALMAFSTTAQPSCSIAVVTSSAVIVLIACLPPASVYSECIHSGPMVDKPRVLLDRPRAGARRSSAAAAGAFAERGFADTAMDDVAAAAGITRLIVYRHFDSKEDALRRGAAARARPPRRGAEVAPGERGENVAVRALLAVARTTRPG